MDRFKKAYVLYANESYFDIVSTCAKSIREFSQLPIIVYILDSNKKIDVSDCLTINWKYDTYLDNSMYVEKNGNFYVNRNNTEIYRLIIERPRIVRDALINYSDTVVYVDSDSVATPSIDNIFFYYPNNCKFPYFTEGVYDWLHKDGKGGSNDWNDLTTTLEYPICELMGIDQYVRKKYRTSNVFITGKNSIEFLEEWYWMCCHPKILSNPSHYAPFQEETVANVLLWKYEFFDGLPYVYMNGNDETIVEIFENVGFDGYSKHMKEWLRIPASKDELFVVHGEKRIEKMNRMLDFIKKYYNI